jgi:hypothetical protein
MHIRQFPVGRTRGASVRRALNAQESAMDGWPLGVFLGG